jgi:signal peptidase
MEPLLQRGDLIFSTNESTPVQVNEVVVFTVAGRSIPIVHRVIAVNKCKVTGELSYLTKGDNNAVDDRALYAPGQRFIKHKDVIGRVKGMFPKLGMARILLEEMPGGMYVAVGLSMLVSSNTYVEYLGYAFDVAVAAYVLHTRYHGYSRV